MFTSDVIHHLVIWSGELIRVLSKVVWKFSNMISGREGRGFVQVLRLKRVKIYWYSFFSENAINILLEENLQ